MLGLSKTERLLKAVSNDQLEKIKKLISKGADINKEINGKSALVLAKTRQTVDILLKSGAKISNQVFFSEELKKAIEQNDLEKAKLIIFKGVNVNTKINGNYPLFCTSDHNMLSLLIQSGANIDAKDKHGNSSLFINSLRGETKLVELLINMGANINDINDDGLTPLFAAINSWNTEITKILLDAGAEVNFITKDRVTPLIVAAQLDYCDIVRILLKSGADVHYINSYLKGKKISNKNRSSETLEILRSMSNGIKCLLNELNEKEESSFNLVEDLLDITGWFPKSLLDKGIVKFGKKSYYKFSMEESSHIFHYSNLIDISRDVIVDTTLKFDTLNQEYGKWECKYKGPKNIQTFMGYNEFGFERHNLTFYPNKIVLQMMKLLGINNSIEASHSLNMEGIYSTEANHDVFQVILKNGYANGIFHVHIWDVNGN